ncbi:MAG: hypothetical protein WC913_05140 [Desulfuromonas sp.]
MKRQGSATVPENTAQQGAAVQQGSCPETLLTGIGLSCVTGDQPFALLGAVGTNLSTARPNPLIRVKVPRQESEQPIMSAPLAELEGIELPVARMEILASGALDRASGFLPQVMDSAKVLVVTLLPSRNTARGAAIETDQFQENLCSQIPRLSTAEFRFVDATSGPTQELIECCRELAAGTWQAVLFGGVDSLVDTVSCAELALNGRIMPVGGAEGLVPSEAATYLLLQATDSEAVEVLAQLKGAAQAEELQSGKADRQNMLGQAAAIQAALAQGNLSASALDGVVIPYGNDTASTLEWYQTSQKLWPPGSSAPSEEPESPAGQPPERENHREELQLHIALGETGAAALPLSLALGCARFEFHHPRLHHVLVCAAGDAPFRGAVVLQAAGKR